MVDSVGLLAHTELCNLAVCLLFVCFNRNKGSSTLNCPCSLKYLGEGLMLLCEWLVPRANYSIEVTGFHSVSSEEQGRG